MSKSVSPNIATKFDAKKLDLKRQNIMLSGYSKLKEFFGKEVENTFAPINILMYFFLKKY